MNDRPEGSASHESAPGLASPARFSVGDGACLSGLVALSLAAYANALAVPFLWDDGILLGAARSLTDPLQAFAQPFFAKDWGNFYRPLTTLSFAGGLALSGASPVAFHATNVAAHLLNVALLFLLFRRLGGSRVASAAGVALWGLFPRLTESVTWVAGRTDVFATTCVLGALLAWGKGERPRRRLAAAALLFAGLLFKEVAIAGFAALAAAEIARAEGRGHLLRRLAPLAAASCAYGAARWLVLLNQVLGQPLPLARRLVLPFETLGTYAVMMADPLRPAALIGDVAVPQPLLAGIGFVVAAGLALLAHRLVRARDPDRLGLFALAVSAWFPVSNLFPLPTGVVAADRYLYLPLAGAVGLAVLAATSLSPRVRTGLAIGAAVAIPLFAASTDHRNRVWGEEASFWIDTARKSPPGNVIAPIQLAFFLMKEGEPEEAARINTWILSRDGHDWALGAPRRLELTSSLALGLAGAGRFEAARVFFEQLSRAQPGSPGPLEDLARVELAALRPAEARRALARLAEAAPGLPAIAGLRETADLLEQDLAAERTAVEAPPPSALLLAARRRDRAGRLPAEAAWARLSRAPSASCQERLEAAVALVRWRSASEAPAAVRRIAGCGLPVELVEGLSERVTQIEQRRVRARAAAREFWEIVAKRSSTKR